MQHHTIKLTTIDRVETDLVGVDRESLPDNQFLGMFIDSPNTQSVD